MSGYIAPPGGYPQGPLCCSEDPACEPLVALRVTSPFFLVHAIALALLALTLLAATALRRRAYRTTDLTPWAPPVAATEASGEPAHGAVARHKRGSVNYVPQALPASREDAGEGEGESPRVVVRGYRRCWYGDAAWVAVRLVSCVLLEVYPQVVLHIAEGCCNM